jgi:hypothetical protein
MYRLACMASLLMLAFWNFGCTPRNAPPPSLAPVKGTVNLDGKAMPEGEIRFNVMGQPPQAMPIKDGAFSGEAFVGKNKVDVVLEKKGPPSTTDPNIFTSINLVDHKYSGPTTSLNAEITKSGASDLKFDVTSVPKKESASP